MKPVNQSKALFRGAFILAIAALLTKILSAVYRIPFQNIVGDVGFYIYQQVYPFYGLAMVLATTGFPVVISKLYAEQKVKKDERKTRQLLLVSYIFLQLFGLVCFLIFYVGAEKIALFMNDPQLTVLLRVVSFVYLLFPIVSILRGYFQGIGDMVPTALSQVGEQFIRAMTILFLAYILTQKGYSLYLVGGGAMFGSITGSIVAVLILFMFLLIRKEWRVVAPSKGSQTSSFLEANVIVKALIFQGLMICISGMLLIFLQLADALNLYSLLVANGYEENQAKSLKGIFDRGQPLIQLGTVVATAMSLSLVPLITSVRLKKDTAFLHNKIKLAIRVSIVIGAGASAGLWTIIAPTNIMLFENQLGSSVLGLLSLVILFTSVITPMMAIMQGLGNLLYPAVVVVLSFPIKYGLNFLFVPSFDTMGAAYATVITLAIACILITIRFKSMVKIPLVSVPFVRTVIIASLIMVLFLKTYLYVTDTILLFGSGRVIATVQALGGVFSGGFLFMLIVIRQGVFNEWELALFPLGSKLSLLLPKRKRS